MLGSGLGLTIVLGCKVDKILLRAALVLNSVSPPQLQEGFWDCDTSCPGTAVEMINLPSAAVAPLVLMTPACIAGGGMVLEGQCAEL